MQNPSWNLSSYHKKIRKERSFFGSLNQNPTRLMKAMFLFDATFEKWKRGLKYPRGRGLGVRETLEVYKESAERFDSSEASETDETAEKFADSPEIFISFSWNNVNM